MTRKKVTDPSTRLTGQQRLDATRAARRKEVMAAPSGQRVKTARATAQRELDRARTGREADERAKRTISRQNTVKRKAPNKAR